MPPKLTNDLQNCSFYVDGKRVDGICEISLEPYEHEQASDAPRHLSVSDQFEFTLVQPYHSRINELIILQILKSNNWLKMHGLPMKRKPAWVRKMSHFKRTMKQLSDI